MLKKLVKVVALATALCTAPVAASAVSVSSGNGSGSVTLVSWTAGTSYQDAKVKSSTGKRVYISGKVGVKLSGDYKCAEKITPDVTSSRLKSYPNRRCDFLWPEYGIQGFAYEHCRNLSGLPDPCGGWSKFVR